MRKLSLVAALLGATSPVFAEDAAVLIGNDRYDEFRRVNDATDVLGAANDLEDAGYEVMTLANGTAADMRATLDRFASEALSADRLIVALSGRFATDEDRTWFLGDDADTPTPFGLDDAISVDTVMQVLARAPGQAILVLGYDQDGFSSFGRYMREGVGRLNVPQGVTVIYGEPDRVEDVFDNAITREGADVMGYVRDNRRLNVLGFQPETLVMQPAPANDAPVRPTIEPSLAAWNAARQADTADAYREFIFENPRSPFVDEARTRLDAIETDPATFATTRREATLRERLSA